MNFKYPVILLMFILQVACHSGPQGNSSPVRPDKGEIADLNRYLVTKDRERIQNYIERKHLRMTETKTGLWYQIVREGQGSTFRESDHIVMDYECSLLDGTGCYSSRELGPKELILGRSEMEAGLNEGLRLLKPGSEAIFIIPPFLAYGLVGDRKHIPPRAVIVYNVRVRKK